MPPKITIILYRQYLQTISDYFFPGFHLYKNSNLVSGKGFGEMSNQHLDALVVASIIEQLDDTIKKRLLLTTKPTIKLNLSYADAIVFYKFLFFFHISADKLYYQMVRQDIIARLHFKLTSVITIME